MNSKTGAFATSLFAIAAASGAARAEAPRVVADIAPVHSLVAQVMGDLGTPDLLVRPGASPHGYSLRPSEARNLQEADLVVWIGEDLAPWMEGPLETLGENARHLALMEQDGTLLLEFREGATFEAHDHGDHGDHDGHGHEEHADAEHDHDDHGHEEHAEAKHDHDDHGHEDHAEAEHDHDHDHEEHADASHDDHAHDDHGHEEHAEAKDEHAHDDHGHDDHAGASHDHDDHGHDEHAHGEHDPHIWLHPDNAKVFVAAIADALSEIDPDHAGTYAANAAAAVESLTALEAELSQQLAPAQDVGFVVFHDAYQYFESAFGLQAAGAISLGDATAPSAARLTEVRDKIADLDAVCVGAEPQFDPRLVETVAEGTGARTVVMDPLGVDLEVGPALYGDMMRGLAEALASCSAES